MRVKPCVEKVIGEGQLREMHDVSNAEGPEARNSRRSLDAIRHAQGRLKYVLVYVRGPKRASRRAVHDFRLPRSLQLDPMTRQTEDLWEAQNPDKNSVVLGQFRNSTVKVGSNLAKVAESRK